MPGIEPLWLLGFLTCCVVLPGIAVQRVLRLPADPALVLPAGWALCALAHYLGLLAGWPAVPVLAVAAASLLVLLRAPRSLRWADAPGFGSALSAFAVVVGLLALTRYPLNRLGPEGELALDRMGLDDMTFHAGLAWELTHAYPPQVPGLSGVTLDYHLGADLVRASAQVCAGISPLDFMTRVEPTASALGLAVALATLCGHLGLGSLAVRLAPWTLLATGFSFAFGWHPRARYWTDLFGGDLLLALVLGNAVVMSLAMALGSLIALARHLRGEGRGWLALACGLAAASAFFKVFAALLLLAGLLVALARARPRHPVLVLAAVLTAVLLMLALGPGAGRARWVWDPTAPFLRTRARLGLSPLGGLAFLGWALVWIFVSLGLRVFGLGGAVRAACARTPLLAVVGSMALLGWPAGILVRLSPRGSLTDAPGAFDTYFLVLSGALLWLFAVARLAAAFPARSRRAALLGVLALLALPGTVQFAARKIQRPPQVVPPEVIGGMRVLAAVSRPGDVVLARPTPRFPPPPLVLAGRRVPLSDVVTYLDQFAPPDLIRARREAVETFFATQDAEQARRIAVSLGARFVCLYAGESLRFETAKLLDPEYLTRELQLYRFRQPGPPVGDSTP